MTPEKQIEQLTNDLAMANEIIKTQKLRVNLARTLVATLYWNFNHARTEYNNDNKHYPVDLVAEAYHCFLRAYKLLKKLP